MYCEVYFVLKAIRVDAFAYVEALQLVLASTLDARASFALCSKKQWHSRVTWGRASAVPSTRRE